MTNININKLFSHSESIRGLSSVSYYGTGSKTYSAITVEQMYGVFVSNVLIAPSQFLRWRTVEIDCTNRDNIWIYIRNAANSDIETAEWQGPFKNEINSFESLTENLLQIMLVVSGNNLSFPIVSGLKATFVSSQGAKYFFTKAFNLGFRAKHIALSYNAEKSSDAILRFAVTGEDTADLSKYQFIEPNRVEELYGIPLFSDKIKLMMEIAGDSGVPISVSEIAMMFSGDEAISINQEELITSSSSSSVSSSSSSSESSFSSSSSSIDSSSSSSSGFEGAGHDRIAIDFGIA